MKNLTEYDRVTVYIDKNRKDQLCYKIHDVITEISELENMMYINEN